MTTFSPSGLSSPGSASFAEVEPSGALIQGAVLAKAEESGDYSTLASSGQGALISEYGFYDADELMTVAASVLHEQTLLPIAKTHLTLQVMSPEEGSLPAKTDTSVVVFDWDRVHYIYNPDLGTFGLRIPRNSVTGLPALVIRDGDVLEALYFYATFREEYPAERAVVVPARDGQHAGVAFSLKGRTWVYSPVLGKFPLPPKYRIDDLPALVSLHSALVARQQASGQPSPTATPRALPGDSADLQVRRAYLALREAGYTCALSRAGSAPVLSVAWRNGSYRYLAPEPT